jgi:prolyl 4-hydroxylase
MADSTLAFGERQSIPSQNVLTVVQTMLSYMTDTVQTNDTYAAIRDECRNRHAQCAEWAAVGECQANPGYMRTNCAPTCGTCELLDFNVRCPFDKDAPKVLPSAGYLNQWFERLLFQATENLSLRPTIVSAPAAALERRKHDAQIDIADNVLEDGPWVVTIPNFLSPAECEHLIALGAKEGYERSKDVGSKKFDGTFEAIENTRRTSTNAWCKDECFKDPVTQELTQRLEELTGIPANNSEYWQLLKYEEGQEYMEQ